MQIDVDEPEVTLLIAAASDEFLRATAWLQAICHAREVPPDQQHRLDICLNEALANVLAHGGSEALGSPIELRLVLHGRHDAGRVSMTLRAGGVAFDPNSHRQKPAPQSLEEAEPGGLGILLMRANADEIRYQRLGKENCTTFVIRWDGAESAEHA